MPRFFRRTVRRPAPANVRMRRHTKRSLAATERKRQLAVSKPHQPRTTGTMFPVNVDKIFVISIRPKRWKAFKARMGPWAANAERFAGSVDGRTLDRATLQKQKIIDAQTRLSRGQIGCFLSHRALWKHAYEQKLDRVLICEDDAAIYNTKATERFLDKVNSQMTRFPSDVVMLGHHAGKRPTKLVSANLESVNSTVGLFAYVVTRVGLEKLLRISLTPLRLPIDNALTKYVVGKEVIALRTKPAVCFVVHVISDTQGIR